ncbi:unnamed protein product [Prorocentrum cordatum]|uniref:Poly(ADP-ribose) glycohydrolase n=1 Tax=Prorocentrum cordatum TaxID=2364126 RepID=A0ABN9R504_9DINO|nr:unnamed protein product [Polarella glacialis]
MASDFLGNFRKLSDAYSASNLLTRKTSGLSVFAEAFEMGKVHQALQEELSKTQNGQLAHVSRRDRIYVTSLSAFLPDFAVACSVLGKAALLGTVSDHIPVMAAIRRFYPAEFPQIPSWIGRHPICHTGLAFLSGGLDGALPTVDQATAVRCLAGGAPRRALPAAARPTRPGPPRRAEGGAAGAAPPPGNWTQSGGLGALAEELRRRGGDSAPPAPGRAFDRFERFRARPIAAAMAAHCRVCLARGVAGLALPGSEVCGAHRPLGAAAADVAFPPPAADALGENWRSTFRARPLDARLRRQWLLDERRARAEHGGPSLPSADDSRWRLRLSDVQGALDGGTCANTVAYSACAFSTLSFLAQLGAPPSGWAKLEAEALQMLFLVRTGGRRLLLFTAGSGLQNGRRDSDRWARGLPEHIMLDRVMSTSPAISQLCAPRVLAACIRTLWNCWATSRRFQRRATCFFGCSGG